MTTSRQVAANRRNARSSTGPRTRSGKKRSARNATQFGLSLPVVANPVFTATVSTVMDQIAGDNATKFRRGLAREIAEAQVDLIRIRQARDSVLAGALNLHPSAKSQLHSEAKGIRDQKHNLSHIQRPSKIDSTSTSRPDPGETANVLCEAVHQLTAIHRYERRALSRRKFAIREYDALRRKTAKPSCTQCIGK